LLGITYFGFEPLTIKVGKEKQTTESNLLVFKIFYILIIICFALSACFGPFIYKYIKFISSFIIFLFLILFPIIINLIL